jgi:IS30 family transposase
VDFLVEVSVGKVEGVDVSVGKSLQEDFSMNKKETKKHLHLSLDDRIEIQECLSHGMTFKAIGRRIDKDPTTVSKEVKKHVAVSPTKVIRTDRDGKPVVAVCPKLLKPPFVCNPCPKAHSACGFDRHIYRAKTAHGDYERLLSEARDGIMFSKQEFFDMDAVISDGIKNGQHLYQILQTKGLNTSKTTVYRHLKKGYLSVAAIDFPRVVKFKPRGEKSIEYVPKGLKIGRSYSDFLLLKENDGFADWVEMDTVVGKIGGKTVLTFCFVPYNFMFGLLLASNSSPEVSKQIRALKERLLLFKRSFAEFFARLLTDNGGEFSDVFTIENTAGGQKEISLFFCDPLQSNQKAHIEKNHTLFRDIAPKGTSFDSFTQEHLNIIFSHVNAVKRPSFAGKSAYDMFSFVYGANAPALFDIVHIPPESVVQTPKLLRLLGIMPHKT